MSQTSEKANATISPTSKSKNSSSNTTPSTLSELDAELLKAYPHLSSALKYNYTRSPIPWLYVIIFMIWYQIYPWLIQQTWFDQHRFPHVFTEVQYFILACIYFYMDHRPNHWWGRYKIKPVSIETQSDMQMLPTVIFNHIFFAFFVIYIYEPYLDRGLNITAARPYVWTVFWEIGVYVFFYDLTFYYGHRLLHWPKIFPYVHQKHHVAMGTICIAGWYMTPIDVFLEVFVPFWTGPLVYNGHWLSLMIYSCIGVCNSLHSHSAYVFPGWPSPEDHFVHHNMWKKNFSLKIFDVLHDTYLSFLQMKTKSKQ